MITNTKTMQIFTPSTAASIAIAAVWLITTFCSTSSPCCSVAGSNELVVDEYHNPLTAAVLAVDKDSYKLVRLETLNYDHDAEIVREVERRRLEKNHVSNITDSDLRDLLEDANHQEHRKLWHADPVAPYPVCYSVQVSNSFLTARRRLMDEKSNGNEEDSIESYALSLFFEETQQENGKSGDSGDLKERSTAAVDPGTSLQGAVDNLVSSHEVQLESRALQTTTCANSAWKYNSCCGACGPSFSSWTDLYKATTNWANGVTTGLGNINCWDVKNVTNMWGLFNCSPDWCNVGFSKFNGNITCWDVSNVKDFSKMFYKAASFNQDLSRWKLSSATTIKNMFYSASSFQKNLCAWYCSLNSFVISNSALYSGIFTGTKCSKKGSIGIARIAMCETCGTFQCPVTPSRPAPAKPAPKPKPAPAKPAPKPRPSPAAPKPAPKPVAAKPELQLAPRLAPTPAVSPVKPVPVVQVPLATAAPNYDGGVPTTGTGTPAPTPTPPAVTSGEPTPRPVTAAPVTAAPVLNAIYGYYSSDTYGYCYGELSFVNWSTTNRSVATISYQQGAAPVSSGVYNTATNKGTINFPDNTTGFTFDPDVGSIQWDVGGGIMQRDSTDCGDTAQLFDGTTNKWKVLGSTAVIEVLTCDHTKALPGFRIYAADSFPELDPNKYWLRGYKYSTNSWVTIEEGSFTLPPQRNAPGMALNNPNANYYEVRYTTTSVNTQIYDKYVIGLQRLNAPALQVGEIVLLQITNPPPTKKPTKAPTMKPTMAPTNSPTKTPTKSPTSSPTITPQLTCPAPTSTPQVCDNGLVPGDVVVTAFNTDTGSGAQTVVLLTSSQKLSKGDTIYMTDRPLNCDASCNCDFLPLDQTYMDGTVMFTAPEPILAGTSIAYSQYKKPFAAKDVYFAWGKGESCQYADAWSQVTWSTQTSTSQFHLYSYKREDDLTPYDILAGDNIFLYCMGSGKPVILFGLMLTDEINVEQGWTPYNRNLHSNFHNDVSVTFKVASKKSHKPPNAPTLLLSPNTVPPHIEVQCTCTPPPDPTFLGCFKDSSSRTLPVYVGILNKDDCINTCRSSGYHFAGQQYYNECWCGNSNNDGLASYDENDYAKYGPSTACTCDDPSFKGHWVNCVYEIPPMTTEYVNNHFQCDDGYSGWCKANYDCLSAFSKGSWEDGCGIKGVAKKWEYRNNWRVQVPPVENCKIFTPEDLVLWITDSSHWSYTRNDYDFPPISTMAFKTSRFVCAPPADNTNAAVTEMIQAAAVAKHAEEMEMIFSQKQLEKASAILKVAEVKEAIARCVEFKSMYMPDGVTPIPGNGSPNTQITDPRLPKCFGKGPLCLEPGMVSSRQVQQITASQEEESALTKFGAGKVLSSSSSGLTSSTTSQSNLGTF